MRSLRRLSRFTFLTIAFLLAILVWTGFKQNSLIDSYNSIVAESERTIFFYATLREQITEGLLSRDSTSLLASATEFEKLNGRNTLMLDNYLIPSQYKLSFLKDLDLQQMVVSLRKLAEDPDDNAAALDLLSQLRQINKQFLQFDRIVNSEMRSRVMQYQKGALILMGIIIALTCFTLITLYKKSVRPLIDLAAQAENAFTDGEYALLVADKNSSEEINILLRALNRLLDSNERSHPANPPDRQREVEVSAIINEVINGLNGIINYSQLLMDYCEVERIDDKQKKMLYKIMETGEKSAAILQDGFHRD